jgi:DNA-binding MarR family transcriptional regulator
MTHSFCVQHAIELKGGYKAILFQHIAFMQSREYSKSKGGLLEIWARRPVSDLRKTYPYMTTDEIVGNVKKVVSMGWIEEKQSDTSDRAKSYRLTSLGWKKAFEAIYNNEVTFDQIRIALTSKGEKALSDSLHPIGNFLNDYKVYNREDNNSHSKESAGAYAGKSAKAESDFEQQWPTETPSSKVEKENPKISIAPGGEKIENAAAKKSVADTENSNADEFLPGVPDEWQALAKKAVTPKILTFPNGERVHEIQTPVEITNALYKVLTEQTLICERIRREIQKPNDYDLTGGFGKFLENTLSLLNENSGGYVRFSDFTKHVVRFAPAYIRAKKIEMAKNQNVEILVNNLTGQQKTALPRTANGGKWEI